MSDQERMLAELGEVLSKIARPHHADDVLPFEVRAYLCQLGFPCSELTTREEVIARLWARKRSLLSAIQPEWGGGPGITPPSAA
jgi:hypothetical protein